MSLLGILRVAAPRGRVLAGAALVGAASDLAALALTVAAVWLITRASQQPSIAALSLAIVGVRAFALSRGVLRYWERLLSHDAALRALVRLRTRVYAALAAAPARASTAVRDAELQARLVADVEVVQDLLLRGLIPVCTALLVGSVAAGFAWLLLPVAGAALATGLLLTAVAAPGLAGAGSLRVARRSARARAELAVATLDLMAGAADLAAAGADGVALARAERRAAEVERSERSGALAGASALVVAAQVLTAVAVAWAAVLAVREGRLAPVWVPVLPLTALAAFEVVKPLVATARCLVEARGATARLAEILAGSEPPEESDAVPDGPGVWELDRVRVSYRPQGRPALDGVSLRLAPGRSVALVGASGSGKSTLLGVLARQLEAQSGRVTLDGTDLRRYPADDVRARIAGLFQDAHVFSASVAANLRLAAPGSDAEDLREAARQARLLDWVEGLPAGWDTVLGEDGSRMSGGQRKRLLLARALLADRPLMLLDEPTEGLDSATADAVLAEVLAASRGLALCVATHRLAGLEFFDEIVVLDSGRVVQRGPHCELVTRPGPYQELWTTEMLAEANMLSSLTTAFFEES